MTQQQPRTRQRIFLAIMLLGLALCIVGAILKINKNDNAIIFFMGYIALQITGLAGYLIASRKR